MTCYPPSEVGHHEIGQAVEATGVVEEDLLRVHQADQFLHLLLAEVLKVELLRACGSSRHDQNPLTQLQSEPLVSVRIDVFLNALHPFLSRTFFGIAGAHHLQFADLRVRILEIGLVVLVRRHDLARTFPDMLHEVVGMKTSAVTAGPISSIAAPEVTEGIRPYGP